MWTLQTDKLSNLQEMQPLATITQPVQEKTTMNQDFALGSPQLTGRCYENP